jgi:tetratricopeptide (TPR) repeat protein
MTRAFRVSFLSLTCATFFAPVALSGVRASAQITGITPDDSPTKDRAASYYHYGLAKLYENQAEANGRQDMATQAIEQYKLALDSDPDSRTLQDGLANLYFRLGRIREAVSEAQEQVKKHPDDVEAHILLGRVYLRSLGDGQGPESGKMLTASIEEYEKIAKLKPNDLETRLLLGQLYGLNHDSAKAEEQFKAAQGIDPNSEEVVLSMARLYSEQGDFEKAAKVISDVPEGDRSERMDFALAGLYDELKRPKEAVAAYQAVLEQNPDNADAKRGLARALTESGQMDAAAKIYAQMLGADPQDAQAMIHEADIQRQQGHYEEALATLKKASMLAPDDLQLEYNEALCYDALARYDDAEKLLKDMLATSASADGKYSDADRSNRELFLDRLAIIYRESDKPQEAVDVYKQMAALGGAQKSAAYDGEVNAYRDAHMWSEALKVSEEIAKENPTDHAVQLTYAGQLADAGKLDEALKLAQAQLSGTPDDRDVYFAIADMDARVKRWKDTAAALDKVETLSTKPAEKAFLASYRADIAQKQKLYDEAEAEYRKALTITPDNAAVENDYGYMLADRGVHLDDAVAMLKKAVDFEPQYFAYLDSLAWAYYKLGQYTMAEDYEQRAIARQAHDPTLRDHLGEIYAKTGKLQQAIVEWQKSLKDYGTSLAPDADPADVAKVQHKLEGARVRLAHAAPVK